MSTETSPNARMSGPTVVSTVWTRAWDDLVAAPESAPGDVEPQVGHLVAVVAVVEPRDGDG